MLAKGKHFVGFGSSTFSFFLVRPLVPLRSMAPLTLDIRHIGHIVPSVCVHTLGKRRMVTRLLLLQREHRVLSGSPRSSSVLVDASVIGTDPLFNSAGTVV